MWIVLYLKFKWHSYSHFMPINMLDDKFKHWQNVNHRIWLRWPKSVSIGAHCLVFFCIENDSHFFVLYSSASGSKKNEKKCLAVSTIETNRINRKKIHVCSHHDEHPHPHNSRVRLSHIIIYFLLHLLNSTPARGMRNLGPNFFPHRNTKNIWCERQTCKIHKHNVIYRYV